MSGAEIELQPPMYTVHDIYQQRSLQSVQNQCGVDFIMGKASCSNSSDIKDSWSLVSNSAGRRLHVSVRVGV